MPIKRYFKIRRATTKSKLAEITLPFDWVEYHDVKFGDYCTVLADGLVVILRPGATKEEEEEVKEFLERGMSLRGFGDPRRRNQRTSDGHHDRGDG
jgi:hypothetical protein